MRWLEPLVYRAVMLRLITVCLRVRILRAERGSHSLLLHNLMRARGRVRADPVIRLISVDDE